MNQTAADPSPSDVTVLEDWARKFGSDRLKYKIVVGGRWEGYAAEEYALYVATECVPSPLERIQRHTQGWDLRKDKNPKPEHVKAAEWVRLQARAKELPAEADVMEARLPLFELDKERREFSEHAELRVTVTCPNGTVERVYYFLPPDLRLYP